MFGICQAISQRKRLSFSYGGLRRVVEPYCQGMTRQGREVLRAVQVDGESRRGGLGFGKLWHIEKITQLELLPQSFSADDPNYNSDDRAIADVHCRVEKGLGARGGRVSSCRESAGRSCTRAK